MNNSLRLALGILDRIAARIRERLLESAGDVQVSQPLERALQVLMQMKSEVRAGRLELDASEGGDTLGALLEPLRAELAGHGLMIRQSGEPAGAQARIRTPCPALRAESPERWRLIVDAWGTWGCREHLFVMLHGMRHRDAKPPSEACRAELQALMDEHDEAFPEYAPRSDAWVKP